MEENINLFLAGQFHIKTAAAGRIVLYSDPALMGGYDFFCDTETKTKVFSVAVSLVGAIKPVKDQVFFAVRNAAAGIGKAERKEWLFIC